MGDNDAPMLNDDARASSNALDNVRPIVADNRRSFAVPIFVVGLVILSLLLFSALNAQRRALSAPATQAPAGSLVDVESSVQPLYIPPAPTYDDQLPLDRVDGPEISEQDTQEPDLASPNTPVPEPIFSPAPDPGVFVAPQPLASRSPGNVLVYDRSGTQRSASGSSAEQSVAQSADQTTAATDQRVRAGRLSNPSTTVVQGTVIPAVLETAIDTNRNGAARAIVSQDVSGFDGTRVLIPRGSRLIGSYGTDLAAGQNRVLVEWTRLIRPDGVTIALDSPSADRLGRAGIRGDVDSQFWERFTSAIFRTALDVGAIVAARQIDDGAFVILPQNVRDAGSASTANSRVQRTLSVDQGAAVSVFVARDLDFTPVEGVR